MIDRGRAQVLDRADGMNRVMAEAGCGGSPQSPQCGFQPVSLYKSSTWEAKGKRSKRLAWTTVASTPVRRKVPQQLCNLWPQKLEQRADASGSLCSEREAESKVGREQACEVPKCVY